MPGHSLALYEDLNGFAWKIGRCFCKDEAMQVPERLATDVAQCHLQLDAAC